MGQYLVRRLLAIPPLLLGASLVVFLMLRLSPGDPAEVILAQAGAYANDRQALEELRRAWGLDLTLPAQYARWLGELASGELGRSFATNRPVSSLVGERLPATLALAGSALVLGAALSIPLAVISAARAGGLVDAVCRLFALAGVSVPAFWLGLLLVWLFAVRLGWLPATGGDTPRHLIPPAVVLAAGVAAGEVRLLRASMLEVLGTPATTVARAKGLPERLVLMRHVLRRALIPFVTSLGLSLGSLLGGAAVVETVFAYPGLGKLAVDAIGQRDYPVIQAFVLLTTLVFITANFMVDALYAVIDPRIRLGAGAHAR
jgi:ABC-type dipeptide/oligopeptide/nickel transport system permease component